MGDCNTLKQGFTTKSDIMKMLKNNYYTENFISISGMYVHVCDKLFI